MKSDAMFSWLNNQLTQWTIMTISTHAVQYQYKTSCSQLSLNGLSQEVEGKSYKVTYSVVFCCFKSTCNEECLQTDWSGAPGAQWLYTSHTAPLTSVELHKLLVNEAILNWNEEWSKEAVSEGQSETFLYLSKVFN